MLTVAGITFTDTDLWNLKQALAGATAPSPTPTPTPSPTPTPTPAGVRIVNVAFSTLIGVMHETVGAGEVLAFRFTPSAGFSSNGKLCFFKQSPTDGGAYHDREVCLSDVPGDFSRRLGMGALVQGQEASAYFSVGGYPSDKYGRPVTTYPNLTAGQTYYVNVAQVDPSLVCHINYGLVLSQ